MSQPAAAFRRIPGKQVSGAGGLMQRLVYSNEELVNSLGNSLRFREQEIAQRNSISGRLMALVLGRDDGRSIEIDGMRLHQLLALVNTSPDEKLDLNGFYEVNLEYFRAMLRQAETRAAATPEGIAGV